MKLKSYSKYCMICAKCPVSGNNKPHSLHRTKRTIKPNIQKWQGLWICTRCKKTLNKKIA